VKKILLLEDDELFAETLVDFLEECEFEVAHAINGEVALEYTYKEQFDIYLFDINVALIDGITLLSELRHASNTTPAIYITSHTEKSVMQKAFVSGGDDYIQKPFDFDELLWRIEAKIKNTIKQEYGSFRVEEGVIFYKQKRLELSVSEQKVLKLLIENRAKIVTKEQIEEALWSVDKTGSSGAIRVYITRIKQILKDESIKNIRGVGYSLV